MAHHPLVARLAWFLSLLAISTSVVHMAVVRHERCPEHGELVEVRGAHPAGDTGAGLALSTLAFGDQHDEHCPLANAPVTSSASEPMSVALDRLEALAAALAQPPGAAHPSVAALDVAPKHGPPPQTA